MAGLYHHGGWVCFRTDGLACGHRLGVEELQLLALVHGPGARLRVAAADQVVDLRPRLAPVDPRVVGGTPAIVGGQYTVTNIATGKRFYRLANP